MNPLRLSTKKLSDAVVLIVDFEGGLLIAECNYSYPVLIYDVSRSDINYDRQKAEELRRMHTA